MEAAGVNVPAYGFFWLKKLTDEETPGNRGLSLYSRVFFVNKVHRKLEN